MKQEAIDYLSIQPDGTYVDLTFGGGGHARAILERLRGGTLWAFDQDTAARREACHMEANHFHFVQANFRFFGQILRAEGVEKVDGILADLGVSSHQLDTTERGFAARLPGPLDMRMYQEAGGTAADLIATSSLEQLREIFHQHADIRNASLLAQKIAVARGVQAIETTQRLREVIEDCLPPKRFYQYLAKVFQALRIAVNDEMGALEAMLKQLPSLVREGGRVVIISYHSGEDRLVKHFFQYGNVAGCPQKDFYGNLLRPFEPLYAGVRQPSLAEVGDNNRSRSARLRCAHRLSDCPVATPS